MDWRNESYVRIYQRDTTTWKRLGWDGQNVLMQVLRKMDLSGVLDIADMEPWEAVALHCGAPEDAARRGSEVCLRLGVLVHNGTAIIAPKYVEAQTANKSDKQRQHESRERRRLEEMQRGVTNRDSAVTERDDESQIVTESHTPSRTVTNGHTPSLSALLCSAMPCDAERDRAPEDDHATWSQVLQLVNQATGTLHNPSPKNRQACETVAANQTRKSITSAAIAMDRDGWARDHGAGPQHFAEHFARYLAASKAPDAVASPGRATRDALRAQRDAATDPAERARLTAAIQESQRADGMGAR